MLSPYTSSTLSERLLGKIVPKLCLPFIHNRRKIIYFNPSYSVHSFIFENLFHLLFPSFHVGANERCPFSHEEKIFLKLSLSLSPSSSSSSLLPPPPPPWSPWLMGREHVYISLESDCRAGAE